MQRIAKLSIVGGGLAGCEAAWQALRQGIRVHMYEMRPTTSTPAHQSGDLAELVCSNTFKSTLEHSAPGQLKYEMAGLDSLIMRCAKAAAIPAGQALGVDRNLFARSVTEALESHPLFQRIDQEVTSLPSQIEENEAWIVATGPLTTLPLLDALKVMSGGASSLHFYDAIAPIIDAESIDMDQLYFANRYDEDATDYLNIPLDKDQYETLINDICQAEKSPLHAFEETSYFEACLPVEVMAERGRETLRFGPLKPVGLRNPHTGHRPWAVIQLRRENADATMFSMVGFQTKMKWGAQKEVFRKLPGLGAAEFFRYGSVHRNAYLHSPSLLSQDLSFHKGKGIFLAGQITGVEGYSESAAMGLIAGRAACDRIRGRTFTPPPRETMLGALLNYVTKGSEGPFQPMNANMGLLPPRKKEKGVSKQDRRLAQCREAQIKWDSYLSETGQVP